MNSQENETKVSLIKPHDIQFENILVNTVWDIMQDWFPRGSNKIIFGFILLCFTNETVITNYLSNRIIELFSLQSMKLPFFLKLFFLMQKKETEITSLTVSLRIFLIFLFLLRKKKKFWHKKQREKQPEYFYFLQ